MSPLAIRRAARPLRRHGAALFAVLAISFAIAVHHGGLPTSAGHHDGAVGAIELCLGVFVAVGAAVAAVAISFISLGRWRPPIDPRPSGLSRAVVGPEPRARAGPVLLSLLCVSRR